MERRVMDHTIGQGQMICALHVDCVDKKCCVTEEWTQSWKMNHENDVEIWKNLHLHNECGKFMMSSYLSYNCHCCQRPIIPLSSQAAQNVSDYRISK